jgi:polyisoprenyl-teichoic acid--peptidoglycan teichoic acid transferase
MDSTQPKPTTPTGANIILRISLLVAFIIAAALTAFLTYSAIRDFVTSWELTSLPGITVRDVTPTPSDIVGTVTAPDVPLQAPSGPQPIPWDGASRVTVLMMGLDYRDWESNEGAPRTDTMILLTIDPINRTAGMLSIPRDLWVNIPGGFNYARINTAYQLGEAYNLPGGGPQLAMDTVEELLGVPIDYYARIDFSAFERFIDEIGGVKLDVPEKITVDPLGDNNTKNLKPGIQTLPGDLALAYARARKTEGGDFDRAQRQQQVILAIRNRILSFDMLPTLIAKSGVLYNELSSGIHTNLTLDESIKLAWLASQIPEDQIRKGIISPPEQVSLYTATTADGQQQEVLKPITEKIRLLRDEIFTDTGPTSPAAVSLEQKARLETEAARVSILNGTYTPGLAALTQEYLQSQGIQVTETGNAQQVSTYTEITFYTGKPYTVQFLVDLMKIDKIRVYYFNDPAHLVDIEVTLGTTWANDNPMP